MATDDSEKDSRQSRIDETLDRLAKSIKDLPPDRQQALDEYLEEAEAADSTDERCKLIDDWDTELDESDNSESEDQGE